MQDLVLDMKADEIAVFQTNNTLEAYKSVASVEDMLKRIEDMAMEEMSHDVSTPTARKHIASTAYKIARTKTYLDNKGKEVVAELKQLPAMIDANRKIIRDRLDVLKDTLRAPLTAWEDEQARIEQRKVDIEEAIQAIKAFPTALTGMSSVAMKEAIAGLEKPTELGFDDRTEEALMIYEQALEMANALIGAKEHAEQEHDRKIAEEARIKAEQEAQAKIEEARQQEEQAKRDRELAEQHARDAELRAKKAEEAAQAQKEQMLRQAEEEKARAEEAAKRTAEMAAQMAVEQERKRKEEEVRKAEQERIAREADLENRKTKNNEALSSLLGLGLGLTDEQAKGLVVAIAKGEVLNVKIHY